jgi:hypothetical protein
MGEPAMAEPRTPGPIGLNPKPAPRPIVSASPTKKSQPGPIGVGPKKSAPPTAPKGANLGAQIVSFASERSGQRVGDGQCFALADLALKTLGARSAADFGTVTALADYKWGTQVSLSDVKPGDIVQFRDFKCTRRDETEDGAWKEFTHSRSPQHTAIVVSVNGNGLLTVIEQNAPPGSPVHKTQLGVLNTSFTRDKTTVTIAATGSIWFYRPQPI